MNKHARKLEWEELPEETAQTEAAISGAPLAENAARVLEQWISSERTGAPVLWTNGEDGLRRKTDPKTGREAVIRGAIYNGPELRKRLRAQENSRKAPPGADDADLLLHLDWRPDTGGAHDWMHSLEGAFAFAIAEPDGGLIVARDPLGIKPLYIGIHNDQLVFAGDIKTATATASEVTEFPPGHIFISGRGMQRYFRLHQNPETTEEIVRHAETARREIVSRLVRTVRSSLPAGGEVAILLSGGLSSSLIAALASRFASRVRTFTIGTQNSRDIRAAREVAAHLNLAHEERILTVEEAISHLPEVIRHLETFDPIVVRNALPHYLLTQLVGEREIPIALSGEGADELFGGFPTLARLQGEEFAEELRARVARLPHTKLQRADRMAKAGGVEIRLPYLDDPELVEYAFRIAASLKVRGRPAVGKWILRQAAKDFLPPQIVTRKKLRFAAGSGLGGRISRYASQQISDDDYASEREIVDGVLLRSKEELFYYRIFRAHFPEERVLRLVGRTA